MKKNYLFIISAMLMLLFSANSSAKSEYDLLKNSFNKESKSKVNVPKWKSESNTLELDLLKSTANPLTVEDFVEISLPYEQTHVYGNQYIVFGQYLLHGVPLKFTLTENTKINFSALNDEWGFVSFGFLFKDGLSDYDLVDSINDYEYFKELPPGTYYLFIHDANYFEYFDDYLECLIRINEFESVNYTELDYSLTVSEANPGDGEINRTNPVIYIGYGEYYRGIGFSAYVEEGINYYFTCNTTTPEIYMYQEYVLVAFKEFFTGDFENDIITIGYSLGEQSSETIVNLFYQSVTTETINLMFISMECYSVISANLKVQEVDISPITIYDLLNEEMTLITYSENLDFNDSGAFDIETSYIVEGDGNLFGWQDEYFFAIPYKIYLSQGDCIDILFSHQMDAYLYLYRKNQEGNIILVAYNDDYSEGYDSFVRFTANITDDYYIVGSTYDQLTAGNYFIYVTKSESMSIYNLLNTEMTSLNYSNQLDFIDEGIFNFESSHLVDGDDYLFRWYGEQFFAVPYKITLSQKDCINIEFISYSFDAYLYLYCKNQNGEIYIVEENDDWNGVNSYIWFSAFETNDYYVVGTSYSPMSIGNYTVKIYSDYSAIDLEKTTRIGVYSKDRTIYVENIPQNENVYVFDISGRMIKNEKFVNNDIKIEVSNAGIYIVRVENEVFKVLLK